MRRMQPMFAMAASLAFLVLIFPMTAGAQSVSEHEFQQMLDEVEEQIQIEVSTAYTQVLDDEPYISVEKGTLNNWSVSIKGGVITDGRFSSRKNTAFVRNSGNSFHVSSTSHRIFGYMIQKVVAHEDVAIITEYTHDKVPALVFSLKTEKNQIRYDAEYHYSSGIDNLKENIYHSLNLGRGLIDQLMKAEIDLYEDARDEMKEKKITGLTNDEFIFLVDDASLYDVEDKPGAALGIWSFEKNGIDYEIINTKDHLEFTISGYAEDVTPEEREKVFTAMKEFVNDNRLDDVSTQRLEWDPDDEDQEALTFHILFHYDGSIAGENIYDIYYTLYQDYADAFKEKLDEILDALEEE